MRILIFLFSTFSCILISCSDGLTQISTTPLSFSNIPDTDPDFTYTPGRGANQWNFQNTVNIPVQGINTTRSDAYFRFTWLNIQPAGGSRGVYDWTRFDHEIQGAIDSGQKFSFGIMQQCGGCDLIQQNKIEGSLLIYPTWLHNQMQAEIPKDYAKGGKWYPDYNSTSFLTAWKALNAAVNNHILTTTYKGIRYQDVIFEIDVRGYGDYGEWTNNDFSGPAGTKATAASLDSIISYTVHSFETFQCVVLQATFDAGRLNNTDIPPETGYFALTIKNGVGLLGWRRENWGWTNRYNSEWTDYNNTVVNGLHFNTEIMSRYKFAPIVGEPADLDAAGNFNALLGQIIFYHVNSFGNGNLNGQAKNAITANNFRAASKAAGFRLMPDNGYISSTISTGRAFSISLNWKNMGVAPTYENWNVVYEFRDSGNKTIWSGTSSFIPRLFLPSKRATTIKDDFTLPALFPKGNYRLYLIIKDPSGYRKPLPLAIKGRETDGSYLISSNIKVETGYR